MVRHMHLLFHALVLTAIFSMATSAAHAQQWTTNFPQALQASQRTGKPLLVNFTGSDWCGWCVRLKQEVFDKPEFKQWAADHVILVELDFPRNKSLPAALKAQNDKLRNHYQIRGFPTILFLNGKGEVIGRSGYQAGGPAAWTKNAQAIIDAAKPKPAEVTSDLIEAKKAAAASGQALMVILETRPAPANDRRIAELLADPAFAELAHARLQIVRLQKEGDAAAPAEQIAAAQQLLDQVKARAGTLRTAVIDPTGDEPKLLFDSPSLLPAKTYLARIKDQLPTPRYQGQWLSDLDQGRALAAALDRPLLVNFTGSEWCPPCIALNRNVFSTDEFKAYAAKNLILVKLDFPRPGSDPEMTPALEKQFRFSQANQVRGLPTVIIFDQDDKPIARTGFRPGDAKAYIDHLQELMKKN